MANFKTHYNVGVATSLLLVVPFAIFGIFSITQALICFALGVFGSFLPDIDIPSSKVARFMFLILSVVSSVLVGSYLIEHIDKYMALGACLLVFIFTLFALPNILKKITFHRGIIHSVPMSVFLVFLVAIISKNHLLLDDFSSWIFGISLGYGFLVHLLLDEIYSVNITGARFKKSFGTALKIFDRKEPFYTSILYFAIFYQIEFLPSFDVVLDESLKLYGLLG